MLFKYTVQNKIKLISAIPIREGVDYSDYTDVVLKVKDKTQEIVKELLNQPSEKSIENIVSFLGVNPALADPNVEIDPKTMEKEHIAIVEDEPLILVLQSFTDTVEKANFLYAKSNEHLGCLVISLLPNTPLSNFDRDLFVKKYLAEKATYVTELKHKIEEALSHAKEYGSREATYDKKVEDIIFGKQEQEGDK